MPPRSVRKTSIPRRSSRWSTSGLGWPYRLGPTEITAALALSRSSHASLVAPADPWCPTFKTSEGSATLTSADSAGTPASPVRMASKAP